MLQKITAKNNIQRIFGNIPWLGTILLQEMYISVEPGFRIRIEVHRKFGSCTDIVDELSPPGTHIQYIMLRADIAAEVIAAQHLPDFRSIVFRVREAQIIFFLQRFDSLTHFSNHQFFNSIPASFIYQSYHDWYQMQIGKHTSPDLDEMCLA
jgi:hypothetical protein